MAEHTINIPYAFDLEVRKYESTDRVGTTLENAITSTLINNDAYLKDKVESTQNDFKAHKDDKCIHVTLEQKTAWNGKAEKTEATQTAPGLMPSLDKTKLDTVKAGAEENQLAFSSIKSGSSVLSANSKTSQVEFVAAENVTVLADNATKKITIGVKNDSAHRLVSDAEKAVWGAKADSTTVASLDNRLTNQIQQLTAVVNNQPKSVIKSIQRGFGNHRMQNYGTTEMLEIKINPVVVEKSILLFRDYPAPIESNRLTVASEYTLHETKITCKRECNTTGDGYNLRYDWQVIEFY